MAIEKLRLLVVPNRYKDVFNILKERLIDYGKDLIDDCASSTKTCNQKLVNSYMMFISACYAFELGDSKISDFYVNYIISNLKLNAVIDYTASEENTDECCCKAISEETLNEICKD